jgi:hypothetical protein
MAAGEGEEASVQELLRQLNERMEVLITCACREGGDPRRLGAKGGYGKGNGLRGPLSPGTAAWIAFTKHAKETQPERFEGTGSEKERLQIAKALRAENEAAYKKFVENFKGVYNYTGAAGAPSKEERAGKLAELKAKAAAKTQAAPAYSSPVKKTAKKAAASPAPAPAAENKTMEKIRILNKNYWLDTGSQGLYEVEPNENRWGAWVGYYQPDNEEGPIRFTESPENARRNRRNTRRSRRSRRSTRKA